MNCARDRFEAPATLLIEIAADGRHHARALVATIHATEPVQVGTLGREESGDVAVKWLPFGLGKRASRSGDRGDH